MNSFENRTIRTTCIVPGCGNRSSKESLRFFRVPNDEKKANLWFTALNLSSSDLKNKINFVCELHFDPVYLGRNRLTKNAIPTRITSSSNKLFSVDNPSPDFEGLHSQQNVSNNTDEFVKEILLKSDYMRPPLLFLDGVVVPSRHLQNSNEVLGESTELASHNTSALPNPSEMDFEYVEIKQEPNDFTMNGQTDMVQPTISIPFLEIKTEVENISSPPSPSPKCSQTRAVKRKLVENNRLIMPAEIYIKSEIKLTMVDQACQTEDFLIQNATQDHKDELIARLKRQNEQLKKRLSANVAQNQLGNIPIESLKGQNKSVRNLTGFPNFATMEVIFKDVEKFIPSGCRLSKFDVFFMTWMKLKLNISLNYLSTLMNISVSNVSRLFHETFIVLNDRLSAYIVWPDGKNLRENTSSDFKQFIDDRHFLIVDCFEMFFEKAIESTVRYKDKVQERSIQTSKSKSYPRPVKHLICFSSTGTIIYLSKPLEMGLSKSCLVQQSGFLDRLDTKNIVLADREFLSESIDNINRQFKGTVPMVKNVAGKLEEITFENTEEFIKIREDIEKRILFMKKQIMMLKNQQPVSAVTNKYGTEMYSDFILKMACAIINLTPIEADNVVKREEEDLDK